MVVVVDGTEGCVYDGSQGKRTPRKEEREDWF